MSSLGVQSIPELYGLLLGWMQYNQAWELLQKTGLVFVPFIGLLLTHSVQPYLAQNAASAVNTSIKRLGMDCISALLVICVACVPCIPLRPHHQLSHVRHTGTTFDTAFTLTPKQVTSLRVPIWWYGVMALSEGITNSLSHLLPETTDLRTLMTTVKLTTVHDPQLRQQLQQFYTQCYLPARQKFLAQQPTLSKKQVADNFYEVTTTVLSQQDHHDTEWLGSHTFLTTIGYYDSLRAAQPITGFEFNPAVDWQAAQVGKPPRWGKPTCREWWSDAGFGLRQQVLALLPSGLLAHVKHIIWQHPTALLDEALQTILAHTPGYRSANTLVGNVGYSHLAAALGTWQSVLKNYPKLYAILQAAPIVRALLLLLFYAFLPFGLVLSRYRVSSLMTGSIFLFSLIFWSYIWQLIAWIDEALIQALYGNWLFQQTPQAVLADGVIGLLMIVAPLFWFTVMGALGIAAGKGVDRLLSGLIAPTGVAAAAGADVLTGAAKTVAVKALL